MMPQLFAPAEQRFINSASSLRKVLSSASRPYLTMIEGLKLTAHTLYLRK